MLLKEKLDFIDSYEIHPAILHRFVEETNQKLNIKILNSDMDDIIVSLKDFFKCTLRFNNRYVVIMPSVIVDELWHTFLLYTNEYQKFCLNIEYFIHHSPDNLKTWGKASAQITSINAEKEYNLLNTYQFMCNVANIDIFDKKCSPLIFDIDHRYHFKSRLNYNLIKIQNKLSLDNHLLLKIA